MRNIGTTAERRRRRGGTRSKEGCRTCRIRRVKCDERKPSCNNCASTGRTCEWFTEENTPPMPVRSTPSTSSTTAPPQTISPIPEVKLLELRGFQFFRSRTVPQLTRFLDSDFWQSVVLQLSHVEPAVLNATIALGTLHELEEQKGLAITKDRLHDVRHQFAVGQYNAAINRLRTKMKDNPEYNSRVLLLVTCIIFVHIELLRGRNEPAIAHLRSGMKIFYGEHPQDTFFEKRNRSTEEALAAAMSGLELQRFNFETKPLILPFSIENLSIYGLDVVRPFQDIAQARRQCQFLIGCGYHFVVVSHPASAEIEDSPPTPHRELESQQQQLMNLFSDFVREMDDFAHPRHRRSKRDLHASIILRLNILTISTFVTTALAGDNEEEAMDRQYDHFERILSLCEQLVTRLEAETESEFKRPTFTAEWALLPPLILTALKCRDFTLRMKAFRLLVAWPHREGFYDGALLVKLAEKVIEMEEANSKRIVRTQMSRMSGIDFCLSDDQTHAILKFTWLNPSSGESRHETVKLEF